MVTVESGFWGPGYALIKDRAPVERGAARVLNRRGMQDVRELMVTLLGTVAGSAALAQYTRKQAATGQQGGDQTMEVVDLVNRVTTAADVTELTANLGTFPVSTTFPANGDGNPREHEAG